MIKQNFKIEVWKRKDINFAPYNPRKMEDWKKAKLRKVLKRYGLLVPVVVNRKTKNLVGGHQRIEQMDQVNKTLDYEIEVAVIDVDPIEEVKINVLLNNPDLQGEYEPDMLLNLLQENPGIDWDKDLLFTKTSIDYFASMATIDFDEISSILNPSKEQKSIIDDLMDIKEGTNNIDETQRMKELKKEQKLKNKELNEAGLSDHIEYNDYIITFVFKDNHQKRKVCEQLNLPPGTKMIPSEVFFEIAQGKYDVLSAKDES